MAYEVSGRITDKLTGEPLAGATVQVEARKAITDKEGCYSISEYLPIAGRMFLEISMPGYKTYTRVVVAEESDHVINDHELEPWPAQ